MTVLGKMSLLVKELFGYLSLVILCLSSRRRRDLQISQEDASFLGMTGGIVGMTKKICHPEPEDSLKELITQDARVKDLM